MIACEVLSHGEMFQWCGSGFIGSVSLHTDVFTEHQSQLQICRLQDGLFIAAVTFYTTAVCQQGDILFTKEWNILHLYWVVSNGVLFSYVTAATTRHYRETATQKRKLVCPGQVLLQCTDTGDSFHQCLCKHRLTFSYQRLFKFMYPCYYRNDNVRMSALM